MGDRKQPHGFRQAIDGLPDKEADGNAVFIFGAEVLALGKAAAVILLAAIGVIQAAALILVGVGGVLAKALAIVMTAAAGVLFFCTSFSGGNAVIVILTATALFWLPELAGVLLAGLVLLQRKIADTFLV